MSTEVKGQPYDLRFLSPFSYHRELMELGETQVSFFQSDLYVKRIDVQRFMQKHFHGTRWNAYVLGAWSAQEYNYSDEHQKPSGVYPTWSLRKHNFVELQRLIEKPWSERNFDEDLPFWEKPVRGQPHKIFITEVNADEHPQLIRKLHRVQVAYPEVTFHIRSHSFGVLFGLAFRSGSFPADYGVAELTLPNGRVAKWRNFNKYENTIRRLGFSPLTVTDEYKSFNIVSTRYAAHNWNEPTGLSIAKRPDYSRFVDTESPTDKAVQPHNKNQSAGPLKVVTVNDKITCDACTLWRMCTSYRKGAVCNLSGTESRKLAEMALSRDAGVITDMLASIVSKQADRVESALTKEQFDSAGELDPSIDKMMNSLFRNGVQLAKLRDPSLGSKIIINTGATHNTALVSGADPRAMMATVIEQLESNGIDRKDITEKMVEDVLMGKMTAIEAASLPRSAGEEEAVVIEESEDEPPF